MPIDEKKDFYSLPIDYDWRFKMILEVLSKTKKTSQSPLPLKASYAFEPFVIFFKRQARRVCHFIAFFTVSSALFGQTAAPTLTPSSNPPVTNISYSAFLNAKGTTDPWHFYEATTLIFRSGSPGHYRYEVNPQVVKTPMVLLSEEDAAEYYHWKYASQLLEDTASQSCLLVSISSGAMVSNIDPCLKSNALQIQIQNSPPLFPVGPTSPNDPTKKEHALNNDSFFSGMALGGMIIAAYLLGVGTRDCLRSPEMNENTSQFSFEELTEAPTNARQPSYLRYHPTQELCISGDHGEFFPNTRALENSIVVARVRKMVRAQHGAEVAVLVEKNLNSHLEVPTSSFLTVKNTQNSITEAVFTSSLYGSPWSYEEIVNAILTPKTNPKARTILTSQKKINLHNSGTSVELYGNKTSIVTMPNAYCVILGKTERDHLIEEAGGVIEHLKKVIPSQIDPATPANAISKYLENNIQELATSHSVWTRFQLKINNKPVQYSKSALGNTLEIKALKEKIKSLSGKWPTPQQLLEMLMIMDNAGRVAGFSAGLDPTTGLSLQDVATKQSDKNQEFQPEVVNLTFKENMFIYHYCSAESYLGGIQVPGQAYAYNLVLPPGSKDSPLFKMRRSYILGYTPPTGSSMTDDIAKRLCLIDSRQGFYLPKLKDAEVVSPAKSSSKKED